jgi:hypothetical protein
MASDVNGSGTTRTRKATNRTRRQAPEFRVGGKVWLDMRNVQNVFDSNLLRTTGVDPLHSQGTDDPHPGPVIVGDDKKYQIEKIIRHNIGQRRRGFRKMYLVTWVNYAGLTWEPESALEETVTLDVYERLSGEGRTVTG